MFLFRFFKEINQSHNLKCKSLRFSSVQAVVENTSKPVERKYLKQACTRKLKPYGGCNMRNIFACKIDKKVFEYPSVISEESIDTVLNQSQDAESFMKLNEESKLTNDVLQKLIELEYFGLSVPQNFGGAGYTETEIKFLLECIGCNPTIARFVGYNEDFGCRLINKFGTEEQKKKHLPDLAEGRRFMSMAYLENEPVIDLAKQNGAIISDIENSRFILDTEKKWVHYADKADLFLVLAKSTEIEDTNIEIKFKMLIAEKNMPGITVHKLKFPWAEEANLFEVSFKGVCLPFDCVLGGPDSDGFEILKYGLSHCNLTDSTFCLSLMKRIFYEAVQFIEKDVDRGRIHVKESIATFVTYIYALESAIYLLAGSLDMYEKSYIFNDAVMAKVLGIEFLRLAIQLYTDITGHESFKKSEVIEKALEAVQYYSVFDENIEYLKLMSAADGLISSGKILANKTKILRNVFDNPHEAFKLKFLRNRETKQLKSQLNLKMELHSSLSSTVDVIEERLVKLNFIILNLFEQRGSLAIHSEHALSKLAETASYLFATIACLSRASASICYETNNFENEAIIAQTFTKIIDVKVQKLFDEELLNPDLIEHYRKIGKNAFNLKQYPVEHPLARVF